MTDYSLLNVYTEQPAAGLSITFRIGDGTINVTGGSGGLLAVPRPQDNPLTAWRGPQDAYVMEIPLVMHIGNYQTQPSDIEDDCRTLERMCGALVSPAQQPPLLVLNAGGALQNDVVNFPPLRWVISDSPTWGEQWRNGSGRRYCQMVTVKFMNYVAYDELTRSKSAGQSQAANQTIAKTGDTYKSIAARALAQYGGIKWANRLAQLNGARDGAATLQKGQVVKLPTLAMIQQWGKTPRR